MKVLWNLMIIIFALASVDGYSGSLSDAPVVFTSGNWSVLRTTDAMTDKATCTGVYKGDRAIQLNSDALYIRVQGGVESVTLRFDDQPPERMRLATDIEKRVHALVVDDAAFNKLLGSNRVRIQVLTLIRGIEQFDFDLTGLADTIESIREGCPVREGQPDTGTKVAGLCSDLVLKRLQERGVSSADIAYACGP